MPIIMQNLRDVHLGFCKLAKWLGKSPIFAVIKGWEMALYCQGARPGAHMPGVTPYRDVGLEFFVRIAQLEFHKGARPIYPCLLAKRYYVWARMRGLQQFVHIFWGHHIVVIYKSHVKPARSTQ